MDLAAAGDVGDVRLGWTPFYGKFLNFRKLKGVKNRQGCPILKKQKGRRVQEEERMWWELSIYNNLSLGDLPIGLLLFGEGQNKYA